MESDEMKEVEGANELPNLEDNPTLATSLSAENEVDINMPNECGDIGKAEDSSALIINSSPGPFVDNSGISDSGFYQETESQPNTDVSVNPDNENSQNDCVSKLSPFSNSEGSEREIALEPLSADDADDEIPSVDKRNIDTVCTDKPISTSENEKAPKEIEPVISTPIGLSEDREDISDGELDVESSDGISHLESSEVGQPVAAEESSATFEISMENQVAGAGQISLLTLPETEISKVAVNDGDTQGTASSDEAEIIDLKLEDAGVGESDDDLNRHSKGPSEESKGPSEDLEAVSDDELPFPSAAMIQPGLSSSKSLIEGGEAVSSSEDEGPSSPVSLSAQQQSAEETNQGFISSGPITNLEPADGEVTEAQTSDPISSQPVLEGSIPPGLHSLEAEPISEEEDSIAPDELMAPPLKGGSEAGEISSPVDSPRPVPPTGNLLGEVEPVSADESPDTDGELHSGDESGDQVQQKTNTNANFESIDSDEGDLDADNVISQEFHDSRLCPETSLDSLGEKEQKENEYMETISDEENLDLNDEVSRQKTVRASLSQESVNSLLAPSKDSAMEQRPMPSNFNEHQVELDYEEAEGEDTEGRPEGKMEEMSAEVKPKEGGEEGEVAEDGGSEKDEGELSDDDCEEGEIKEPGARKPFVKPICRFFQRGNCTWGINCRFLHPGVNDKGNYQMIEIPGFKPTGVRARLGIPGQWPEQPQEELVELPPPPIPDTPPVETAWERGLRIAKEQRKKASERKEQEPDFEEKRLNLSIDEERELNKENERMPKIIPKDPYYDQQAYEEDEYYKIPRDPWHTGHYENFEVRYNRENSFSPPYREKPPMMPPARYNRSYSPPVDKFGRHREERREPFRQEPSPHDFLSPTKRPDEWTDPWRRQTMKIPPKRKGRSRSRGRKNRRSGSGSSNSSRSDSRSSSGSSRSSRSNSGSSATSSRSKSPEPAPPGVDRHDRYNQSPTRYSDQPRSAVSVRGRGGYNNYDNGYFGPRAGRGGYDRGRGGYNQRGSNGYHGGRGGGGGYYGGGPGGGYMDRDPRNMRGRDPRQQGRNMRGRSPPDRPLPYTRPRRKSGSSHSSSSRSRSRSRSRFSDSSRSRSRSSSNSSRSSSSSSSSAGSADSEHLYRDLGSPTKNPHGPTTQMKKKRSSSHKDRSGPLPPHAPPSQKHPIPPPQPSINLDRIPHPRDPRPPLPPAPPSGRPESKYASRNAPQAPVKAKDPLKVVGQKSNIKLTLLPKQQQSALGDRPNPLDSPPHGHKRRLSEREASPGSQPPPTKRLNLPVPQTSALRIATEKAAKLQIRQEKGRSPPLSSSGPPTSSSSSSNAARAKTTALPQKQPGSSKSRPVEPVPGKVAPKASAGAPAPSATGAKAKKSMSLRREELLKQLKAVEDAIARKKSKL